MFPTVAQTALEFGAENPRRHPLVLQQGPTRMNLENHRLSFSEMGTGMLALFTTQFVSRAPNHDEEPMVALRK